MVFSSPSVDCLARVKRGEDGLNGDPSAGDELTAGAAQRHGDGRRPAVLPDEHAGDGARLERRGGLLQIVLTEQAGRRALELGEAAALLRELGEVQRRHRSVPALGQEREVEDPDDAAIDEIQQERHHLAGDRLLAVPLQNHVIDRAHLFELIFTHGVTFRAEVVFR
jgi:hypothetical protein